VPAERRAAFLLTAALAWRAGTLPLPLVAALLAGFCAVPPTDANAHFLRCASASGFAHTRRWAASAFQSGALPRRCCMQNMLLAVPSSCRDTEEEAAALPSHYTCTPWWL